MDPQLIRDCVHCGFCLPTCPTYELWHEEMDSPRGRIWLMAGVAEGRLPLNDTVVQHFDRCLGCLACVPACPSGVRYDRLIELTRERVEQEHRRPLPDRALRRLLFLTLPHRRRLRLALRFARLAPRPMRELAPPWRDARPTPRVTRAVGEPVARVALLTGCVQSVVFGGVNRATARVLAAHGCDVVAPYDGCCGALALHSGRREEGHARARRALEALADADVVVTNAAGCGSHLKEVGGPRVLDVHELLATLEPRSELLPLPLRVAYQDACHLRSGQRVEIEPRAVLARIPALELVEPAEQELCCGSAGIYNVVQPEAARELGDRKAMRVAATAPDVYAAGNPGCLVQVSAALRRAGRSIPALHPLELVDASLQGMSSAKLTEYARK